MLFSVGLARKIPRILSMKTCISSTAKLTLHVLGADLTAYRLSDGLMHPVNDTFAVGLARRIPRSSSMKTWISSIAKLTLHVLGADLTAYRLSDGLMHPVNV
ncbi:hypothetical protein DY000_02056254 [Brassica cretica]|uniref:Uncharacterized protein n=1 Tax=Brassica cretica TaxID=69181 RepID=A0ABQ7A9W6_BRACR|nr:hypothetical protein DY000_02056254 [Brassica cretica]